MVCPEISTPIGNSSNVADKNVAGLWMDNGFGHLEGLKNSYPRYRTAKMSVMTYTVPHKAKLGYRMIRPICHSACVFSVTEVPVSDVVSKQQKMVSVLSLAGLPFLKMYGPSLRLAFIFYRRRGKKKCSDRPESLFMVQGPTAFYSFIPWELNRVCMVENTYSCSKKTMSGIAGHFHLSRFPLWMRYRQLSTGVH